MPPERSFFSSLDLHIPLRTMMAIMPISVNWARLMQEDGIGCTEMSVDEKDSV